MIPARGPPADHQIRPFCETRAEEIIPLEGLVVGWLQNVLHSHNRGEGGGRDLLILSKIARKSRLPRFDDLGWWPEKKQTIKLNWDRLDPDLLRFVYYRGA